MALVTRAVVREEPMNRIGREKQAAIGRDLLLSVLLPPGTHPRRRSSYGCNPCFDSLALLVGEIAAAHRNGEDGLKAVSHSDIQPSLNGAWLHVRSFSGCRYFLTVSQHREDNETVMAATVELECRPLSQVAGAHREILEPQTPCVFSLRSRWPGVGPQFAQPRAQCRHHVGEARKQRINGRRFQQPQECVQVLGPIREEPGQKYERPVICRPVDEQSHFWRKIEVADNLGKQPLSRVIDSLNPESAQNEITERDKRLPIDWPEAWHDAHCGALDCHKQALEPNDRLRHMILSSCREFFPTAATAANVQRDVGGKIWRPKLDPAGQAVRRQNRSVPLAHSDPSNQPFASKIQSATFCQTLRTSSHVPLMLHRLASVQESAGSQSPGIFIAARVRPTDQRHVSQTFDGHTGPIADDRQMFQCRPAPPIRMSPWIDPKASSHKSNGRQIGMTAKPAQPGQERFIVSRCDIDRQAVFHLARVTGRRAVEPRLQHVGVRMAT